MRMSKTKRCVISSARRIVWPSSIRHDCGGKAGLLIRKHDHFTLARKMGRDVTALTARNHPEWRIYSPGNRSPSPATNHPLQGYLAHTKPHTP